MSNQNTENPIGTSLTHFIMNEQRSHQNSRGDFTTLLSDLTTAGKIISAEVNRAGLAGILGKADKVNIQGEEVQKLDEFANDTIINVMTKSGTLCAMASEEEDDFVTIDKSLPRGDYVLYFDPLDGSSNIDVNISVGTIFSVFKVIDKDNFSEKDMLQKGSEQVCSGYILYGSSTMLVYTTGSGVHGFTLDPTVGEFLLSHENIKTPERGNIYSINEGNKPIWHKGTEDYAELCKSRELRGRYVGSLVADFHRNLLKGGVFLYPGDKKNEFGKLRLMYEANPLALICKEAGGHSSTGDIDILDIVPERLHQRVPLIIGSLKDVEEAIDCWEKAK